MQTDEQVKLPPIGTKAVSKSEATSGKGPVVEVYGHTTNQEVRLRNADHRVNHANGHEVHGERKDVPVKQFNSEYTLL